MARTLANSWFDLRIALERTNPLIWRMIRVPADIALPDLHLIIQTVMGWTNSHLHEFCSGSWRYGLIDEEFPDKRMRDEHDYRLCDLVTKPNQAFIYTYDMGDDWQHTVTLLAVHPHGNHRIECLAGERGGPIEDSGGPHGLANALQALVEPGCEEDVETAEWARGMIPEDYDPAVCPVDKINAQLHQGLDHLRETLEADRNDDGGDNIIPFPTKQRNLKNHE